MCIHIDVDSQHLQSTKVIATSIEINTNERVRRDGGVKRTQTREVVVDE